MLRAHELHRHISIARHLERSACCTIWVGFQLPLEVCFPIHWLEGLRLGIPVLRFKCYGVHEWWQRQRSTAMLSLSQRSCAILARDGGLRCGRDV